VTTVILIAAAFLGGALNSLAGGGTLVTFPTLLLAGLDPIDANASSVVALFSGTFAGAWVYRRNILAVGEVSILGLFASESRRGGLIGALVLLWTPTAIFASLVPWLVLFATVVFAVGNFAPMDAIRRIQRYIAGAGTVGTWGCESWRPDRRPRKMILPPKQFG
jgi:uncharacterized protein